MIVQRSNLKQQTRYNREGFRLDEKVIVSECIPTMYMYSMYVHIHAHESLCIDTHACMYGCSHTHTHTHTHHPFPHTPPMLGPVTTHSLLVSMEQSLLTNWEERDGNPWLPSREESTGWRPCSTLKTGSLSTVGLA